MAKKIRALVTGAGGFIGGWLSHYLVKQGYEVIGTDIKDQPDYRRHPGPWLGKVDLRHETKIVDDTLPDEIYHLAADMGGIGYISSNHAQISVNNTRIDMNMLEQAARCLNPPRRFFYSSSACVYPTDMQAALDDMDDVGLEESDAWPAKPERGYGLEKLFIEELCEYFMNDFKLQTRVARFHNVGGPYGTYDGGREKAPAAICRKVALAKSIDGEIDIWGDGEQKRSFLYVEDVCKGIFRLTQADSDRYTGPLNLGSDRMVSINELAAMVIRVSGKRGMRIKHVPGPQGVRARNSDNRLARIILGGWEPEHDLEYWIERTYAWIERELVREGRIT